jgi:hypothetical protein
MHLKNCFRWIERRCAYFQYEDKEQCGDARRLHSGLRPMLRSAVPCFSLNWNSFSQSPASRVVPIWCGSFDQLQNGIQTLCRTSGRVRLSPLNCGVGVRPSEVHRRELLRSIARYGSVEAEANNANFEFGKGGIETFPQPRDALFGPRTPPRYTALATARTHARRRVPSGWCVNPFAGNVRGSVQKPRDAPRNLRNYSTHHAE